MPDLCSLLDSLPGTAEEIQDLLLAEGCAGRRFESCDCPVAKWLKKHGVEDVYVGETLYLPLVYKDVPPYRHGAVSGPQIAWRGHYSEDAEKRLLGEHLLGEHLLEDARPALEDARPDDACMLPPHVTKFIWLFDRGVAHPDLYEDGY